MAIADVFPLGGRLGILRILSISLKDHINRCPVGATILGFSARICRRGCEKVLA